MIGTERHESRRIDNQLRGRSGRQGDPGRSRFFLSLEDDLMRIFGSDRMGGMLQRLGLKDGEAIVHPWINKALEKAQKKVEARNFDTRKNVLKYDDVMNAQRKEVYAQRKEFMKATDVSETVTDMRAEMIDAMVLRRVPEKAFAEQWELKELADDLRRVLNLDLPVEEWGREEGIDESHLRERVEQAADATVGQHPGRSRQLDRAAVADRRSAHPGRRPVGRVRVGAGRLRRLHGRGLVVVRGQPAAAQRGAGAGRHRRRGPALGPPEALSRTRISRPSPAPDNVSPRCAVSSIGRAADS